MNKSSWGCAMNRASSITTSVRNEQRKESNLQITSKNLPTQRSVTLEFEII
jgi:hypothetical protein